MFQRIIQRETGTLLYANNRVTGKMAGRKMNNKTTTTSYETQTLIIKIILLSTTNMYSFYDSQKSFHNEQYLHKYDNDFGEEILSYDKR